jgi:hypothetical protein
MSISECPACGQPAGVDERFVVETVAEVCLARGVARATSPGGPVECAVISCLAGHRFRCPVEFLERGRQRPAA